MNSLIFDIEISGHHVEYMKHLKDFLCKEESNDNFIFVVHPEFFTRFGNIIGKEKVFKNITFKSISLKEYHECKKGNLIIQSLKIYRLLQYYAKEYKITKAYLLYFNIFQFALGIFKPDFEINGILFSPYYRMEKGNLREKLEFLRKNIQTKLFIRNKYIIKVFILNDLTTANALNSKFRTNKFQMLPDPVPDLVPLRDFSVRKAYNISSERKIFLHFGSLSIRKGTIDILDSFNYLSENDIKSTALILAGKATARTDLNIKSKISDLSRKYDYIMIIYKNEFVSESLMKSYFDQCDFVLIPYKNIESSSGIIGHAIASGKPVIGTNKGLLGEMISKNHLGYLINESSPELIADSFKKALGDKTITISNPEYLKGHTPEQFALTLIYAK